MEVNNNLRIFLYIFLAIIILVLLYFFITNILPYFVPFIIALVLASLIEPAVVFLQKSARLTRTISVVICLGILIAFLIIVIITGTSRLFFEMDRLIRSLPDYQEALALLEVLWDHERLQEVMESWEISPQLQKAVEDGLEDLLEGVRDGIGAIFRTLQDSAQRAVNFFIILLISFIATFFISKDKEILGKSILSLIPEEWQEKAQHFRAELASSAIGFIRAQLVLITVTTIITIIGLEIFQSDYSLILGLISGILDLIPIVGPGLIFVPWIFYSFMAGNVSFAFMLLALYGTMVVVRSMLEPKIIGQNIGVHPVATLISIYLGLRIFGVSGVIIGPAIVIVGKAFIRAGLLADWKLLFK